MPIRFRCEFCQSRLRVASRKAGSRAKCPKCGRPITVPAQADDAFEIAAPADRAPASRGPRAEAKPSVGAEPAAGGEPAADVAVPASIELSPMPESPAVAGSPEPVASGLIAEPPSTPEPPLMAAAPVTAEARLSAEPPSAASIVGPSVEADARGVVADPFAQFRVYDDETELVYEDEEDEPRVEGTMLPFDPAKVTLPRSLLYMQGVLLGVVALVGFALGILVGAGTSSVTVVDEPVPCVISGRIALRTQGDNTLEDHGAVAMVFPQGARPEAKLEILGLRPRDPEPPQDHPVVLAIRNLGGDYARADQDGAFRLHLPDRGKYFLLIISANRRNSDPEIPRPILAQIGRFFQLAPDLFAGYDYRWQEETVRGDRQLNFVF
jgi:hypothetical protein